MRIATANVGRGVSVDTFRANVRRIRKHLAGAIVCFQEVDEADLPPERHIIGRLLRAGWWFAGSGTKVMVAIPHTWKRVDGRVTLAARGIAGVSPDRKITAVAIRHRLRRNLPPVCVIDVHFPYPNPRLSHAKLTQADAAWEEVHAKLCAEVEHWLAKGYTVFVLGDFNRTEVAKPHKRARLLFGAHGIDKGYVVEADTKVQVLATDTVDLTIDGHNAHVVRVALSQ